MSLGTRRTPLRRSLLGFCLVLAVGGVFVLSGACESLTTSTTTVTATTLAVDTTSTLALETTTSGVQGPGEAVGPAAAGGDDAGPAAAAPTTTIFELALQPQATILSEVPLAEWTVYQESDPHIYYATDSSGRPAWDLWSVEGASGGKVMGSVWSGDSAVATIVFKGTGIALVMLRNDDCGKVIVTLDGDQSVFVDTYASTLSSAVAWTSPELTYARHFIKVETCGLHSSQSHGYSVMFDAVKVKGTLVY